MIGLPTLAALEHEIVLRTLDDLLAARRVRQDDHRARLRSTGQWLGREVGVGRMLVAKAEYRLDRLVRVLDPDTDIELHIIPLVEAKAVARAAFLAGLDQGHRELLKAVG